MPKVTIPLALPSSPQKEAGARDPLPASQGTPEGMPPARGPQKGYKTSPLACDSPCLAAKFPSRIATVQLFQASALQNSTIQILIASSVQNGGDGLLHVLRRHLCNELEDRLHEARRDLFR